MQNNRRERKTRARESFAKAPRGSTVRVTKSRSVLSTAQLLCLLLCLLVRRPKQGKVFPIQPCAAAAGLSAPCTNANSSAADKGVSCCFCKESLVCCAVGYVSCVLVVRVQSSRLARSSALGTVCGPVMRRFRSLQASLAKIC